MMARASCGVAGDDINDDYDVNGDSDVDCEGDYNKDSDDDDDGKFSNKIQP